MSIGLTLTLRREKRPPLSVCSIIVAIHEESEVCLEYLVDIKPFAYGSMPSFSKLNLTVA
jgi:hypothetical protein